jgi:hypothetical protein
MTVLAPRPHRRHSHGDFRTHRHDPEPPLSELLDDPTLRTLMRRDRVSRQAIEALIAGARRRLGLDEPALYAQLEAQLLLGCP